MLSEQKISAIARCLLALLLLWAGTSFSAAQSFSFPRLRLAATNGLTNRVFTAGDRVVPEATVSNGVWYRFTVRDNGGGLKNLPACVPSADFATTDHSYVIQPGDAPTTSGTYKFILEQFASDACGGPPLNSATQQFFVVRATAFTNQALTAETNRFTTAQTAFVRVEGMPPNMTNWNVTWLRPDGGSSCVNNAGSDRPDTVSGGQLTTNYLTYPPASSGLDAWNVSTNYNPLCAAFSTADQGEWKLRLQLHATNSVTLPVFLLSNDCVAVTLNPPARAVCAGSSASFAAVTNGTGPFTLVWRKDGEIIPGLTGTNLTIASATVSTSGVYSVEVTGPCGSATNFATLYVSSLMSTQAIPNQVACSNDAVVFTAPTNGAGPYTYQWRRGTTNLVGQTNHTLVLTNVSLASTGVYRVVISNACNAVTNSGNLSVLPGITVTPLTNIVRYLGTFASFSTTASAGSGATNFVWRKDGEIIVGQTNRTLVLSNLVIADSGTYTVTASRTNGCSASASAELLVAYCFNSLDVMLVIDRSESMLGEGLTGIPYRDARTAATNFVRNLVLGTNADIVGLSSYNRTSTLNMTLTNSAPAAELAIHNLPNATNGTSISSGLTTAQGELKSPRGRVGALPVIVLLTDGVPKTNDNDSVSLVLSNAFQAKLAGTRIFTMGLNDGTGTNVDQALLMAAASSTNDYFYANDSSQLTAIFDQISGILCRGPNRIEGPSPSNAVVCAGTTVQFDVSATGCAVFTFQWSHDGVPLAGRTNPSLVLPNVAEADAGVYSVVISSFCGTVTNSATLTVHPNLLVIGPMSQTVCAGANVNFNANASGAGLTYQWRRGLTSLPGQTNAILSLTNVSPADAGNYTVMVSGLCGDTANSTAALVVRTPPAPGPLGDPVVCPGTPVLLSTTTNGTGPLTIVWRKDGVLIPGSNQPALHLGAVNSSSAGVYAVEISGVCGSATNFSTVTILTNTTATPLADQTGCAGATVSFTTTPGGTGPFTFAWRRGGNILPGETNATLLLAGVTTNDTGGYSVDVTGGCGTVTRAALLTVRASTAATPLLDASVCLGEITSFSTIAQGAGPFTYAWRHNGALLDGATNSTLTISNAGVADAGSYSVEVTGACNAVTNSATLVVRLPVSATPLEDVSVCAGEGVAVGSLVSGTGPFTFEWRRDGVTMPGATNEMLFLENLTTNDSAVYSFVAANTCGAVTNSLVLTVRPRTTLAPLADLTACAGETAFFTAQPGGTGPFTFVWQHAGAVVPGATNATLAIANVSTADAGLYSVLVTGACGAASNSATLLVRELLVAPPLTDAARCAGDAVQFTASPAGSGPFTFQWRLDGVPLTGETNATITRTNLSAGDAGIYSVEISGPCNAVTNAATLTVLAPPTATPLADAAACAGTSASFQTTPSGAGPFTFAWRHDGALLDGETNAALTLTNLSGAHAGLYAVEITGACGAVTNAATLAILSPLTTTPLTNAVRCAGEPVNFSVDVTGSGPWQFIWRRNGVELPGETNTALFLAAVTTNDAGLYAVEISGPCNAVTNTATLTVNQLTTVSPLADATVCEGALIFLSVQVEGTGPHFYRWRRNGQLIITTPGLIIGSATVADSGVYSVEVIGACNRVTNSATITVRALTAVAPLTNAVRCAGESVTFEAVASGAGPFTYLWRRDGNLLPGETNATLARTSLTTNDAGLYSVTVTGACNVVTRSATLNVNETVTTTPFADAARCVGELVSFSTTPGGTGPFTIRWLKDGVTLTNETNATLAFTISSINDAGDYSVEVAGACGVVTNGATLFVQAPLALTPLADQTLCLGANLLLDAGVIGSGPMSFQWRKEGAAISDATNATLLLTNLPLAASGNYSVEVASLCGVITNAMTLAVVEPPLVLINQALCAGETVTFTAATGTNAPFTFTWRKDGELLDGETNSTLTITGLTATNAGLYTVEVSGACGHVTNGAVLVVLQPPVIQPPASLARCAGQSATFNAVVSGSGPLTFVWRKDGVLLPEHATATLTLTNVSPADTALYTVEVTGVCAAATNAATLTVSTQPVIAALTNYPVCLGQDALLAPSISGVGEFTKLWRKDGVELPGETNATLFLGAVSNASAGLYTLEVIGACGSATNHTTLLPRTNAVVAALTNQTVCAGGSVTFTAQVTGTGPFTFVWKKDGAVLTNQTSGVLALTNLFPTDGALYTVEVTTFCNTATASALLTVESSLTATPLTATTACLGQNFTFSTVAAGGPPFTYLWRKDGAALLNQTNASLALTNLQLTNAGLYSVEVTGCGRVTNSAQLSVTPPVGATLPPVISACSCDSLMLAPQITPPGAYTYAWRKDGALLAGETNATLFMPTLNLLSPGIYSVEIIGSCNSVSVQTALEVVNVTSGRWTNSDGAITIRDFNSAIPYPSTNYVRCAPRTLSQLRVTLFGLSHGFPDDMDIALIAPNGTGIKLMSDNGGAGANALNNITLVFDDAAPGLLPNNGFIQPGTYRPSDVNEGVALPDSFPSPGPGPSFVYATNFAQFLGSDPNGVWKLFVQDDHGGQSGSITRWVLDFGRDEFVFQNVRLTQPVAQPGGAFQMQLQGEPGKSYYLEASTNLVNWTIIQTNTLPAATMTLTDFTAPQFGYRFYRASGCR